MFNSHSHRHGKCRPHQNQTATTHAQFKFHLFGGVFPIKHNHKTVLMVCDGVRAQKCESSSAESSEFVRKEMGER